jgi:hypothetical protein
VAGIGVRGGIRGGIRTVKGEKRGEKDLSDSMIGSRPRRRNRNQNEYYWLMFYYKLGWWHGGKNDLHTILNLFK